jgi:hypothetical protein
VDIGVQMAVDALTNRTLIARIAILARAIKRLRQGKGGGPLAHPRRADE